jgi:hypothetical protein
MFDFFSAEWLRFEANPIGQAASWLAILALFGVGVARPFLNLPVSFSGTAKLLQFVVIAAVGAACASAFQSNIGAHVSMYVVASLVMIRVIRDNWTSDEALGPITTFVAFNAFCVSLAGANQNIIVGIVTASAVVHFIGTGLAQSMPSSSAEPSSTEPTTKS